MIAATQLGYPCRTVSPTLFRHGAYRFFFFSREEVRMHVHVVSASGEEKLQRIVEERQDEIRKAWKRHFGR